jgi:hypothetical protein
MKSYGLLEGRGTLKVSEIGKKITYPDPENEHERMEALVSAVTNIPLWRELYSKYGVKLPESNFYVHLSRITGADAPEAKKIEDTIQKAYKEDTSYIKPVEKPKIGGKTPPTSSHGGEVASGRRIGRMEYATTGEFPKLVVPEYGATLEIKDKASFDAAEALFKAIKVKIESKKSQIAEEKESEESPEEE